MKKFFAFFLFVILCCATTLSFAQDGQLTGNLQDDKSKPIALVNVSLLKAADTAFVAGTLTAADGTFTIKAPQAGNYFLRFTSIGVQRV